jgi:hypothetical protein
MSRNTNESSLTTPEDRDLNNKWLPDQSTPPLTDSQTEEAMKELNITSFVDKFPKCDRTYADPQIPMQNYSLFSFIPAKGAVPNSNGVFGFGKIRGNFSTEIEANQRSEYLIKNVDSYHQIFHCYVGRPFPLTNSSNYSQEVTEIDLKKEMSQVISQDIQDKKRKEQKDIEEIKQKEQELLKMSKQNQENPDAPVDPYENYITLRVKKAQLTWAYLEHTKKLQEVKDALIKAREEISELDKEHTEYSEKYFEKYMTARRESGLDESREETHNNFIKYMVEDVDLGF